MIVSGLVAALVGCGGNSESGLGSQASYQNFFWEYCLPFAEVLTDLAENENTSRAAGDPIECPGGGTASYDAATGTATLTDCGGAGATANGTIVLSFLESQQATIISGDLTIAGAYEGTATINSGTMSWELPVADATTYWELRLELNGTEVCLWSGADSGPCPQF